MVYFLLPGTNSSRGHARDASRKSAGDATVRRKTASLLDKKIFSQCSCGLCGETARNCASTNALALA